MPIRRTLRQVSLPVRAALGRRHLLLRRRALTGAYPDRITAMEAVPGWALAGYDHPEVQPVSQEIMQQLAEWDYPVLFWLDRLMRERSGTVRLLDAGGHVGSKFRAFGTRLDLSRVDWLVYDLPPMVEAGRAIAERDGLGPGLRFTDDLRSAGAPHILLCSGLLQYLDIPFPEFVRALDGLPDVIILNKVALRDGPTVVTLERIGPAFVPYQMRSRTEFQAELDSLGYQCLDSWRIAALSHCIDSHPELAPSESRGFVLRRLAR